MKPVQAPPKIWIEGCSRVGEPSSEFVVSGDGQWEKGVCLASEESGTEFDGMYDPPFTALYTSTAFQTGATLTGIREDPYDFALAFWIIETDESIWRTNESNFRLAWDAKAETKIHVETEDSHRWLPVRLGAKPKLTFGADPNGEKCALMLCPLIAAYPRWIEPDFGESTEPLHPSKFVTTTSTMGGGWEDGFVTVANPTPLPQWARWTLQGTPGIVWKFPDFSWGQEALRERPAGADAIRKITMPPLIANEHVKVESNPESPDGQFNSDLDTEIYLRTGGVEVMYPIPPRTPPTQIPVSVSHAPIGAGIQVRVPSEWPRPWEMF